MSDRTSDRSRRWPLLIVCLAAVLAVTFAPYAWDLNRLTVRMYLFCRAHVPLTPDWLTPEDYGRLLNVVLFVPVGALLAWWLGRRWPWSIALAMGFSLCIELAQRLPLVGRQSSFEDVACNTLGAALGATALALLRREKAHPTVPGRRRR